MPNRARSGDGQQSGARGRADQRELLQRHLHRARAGALADHDVELVVLHRGIEDLLDRRRHPVNLVDEQDLVLLQVGEHAGEVARLSRSPVRRSSAPARPSRCRSRRPASSCRDRAARTAGRDRAPRRGHARRRSTPAGCRGRDPGRCSRRAIAAAARLRTARRRRRGPAVTRRSPADSARGNVRLRESFIASARGEHAGARLRRWRPVPQQGWPRRPSRPAADDSRGSGAPRSDRRAGDPPA